jgi:putative ABC transport system permease protein
MRFSVIAKVALQSVQRTRMRSSLTALGIIIGVAAVVTMMSIGAGAKKRVEEALARPDSQLLYLVAMASRSSSTGGNETLRPADGLTPEDYYAIRNQAHDISASTALTLDSDGEAQSNGRASSAGINGMDIDGLELLGRKLTVGTMFGDSEVRRTVSVCLLSESLAKTLFGDGRALNRIVRVNNVPFTVIGIASDRVESANLASGTSKDLQVFLPFTSVLRRLDRSVYVTIVMKARSPDLLAEVQKEISDLMEQRRGRRTAQFLTYNSAEAIQAYAEGSRTMAWLLAAVAGISLIVGGVGVMNIMLVSVTERKREIGIRMAVGTRQRDVLRQFLVEALTLSLLGGLIGIILGMYAAWQLSRVNGWSTPVTLNSVVAALLCSIATGIVFGYYPARSAARLDPILALRAD